MQKMKECENLRLDLVRTRFRGEVLFSYGASFNTELTNNSQLGLNLRLIFDKCVGHHFCVLFTDVQPIG